MFQHISVLLDDVLKMTLREEHPLIIDATFGLGGYTRAFITQYVCPNRTSSLILGMDRDPLAYALGLQNFKTEIEKGVLKLVHSEFSQIAPVLEAQCPGVKPSLIVADIGVSSMQLDQGDRGFSFMRDGPLDMRMNPSKGINAHTLVNTWTEEELSRIFFLYGEEKRSRFIAREIVKARSVTPFESTLQLSSFIQKKLGQKPGGKHPATKVFQALRIEVNQELDELQRFLTTSFDLLAAGGLLAIVSFHSLEDRIVKDFMNSKGKTASLTALKGLPIQAKDEPTEGRIIKPFPQVASENEQALNPRSRSGKLRVIEKRF